MEIVGLGTEIVECVRVRKLLDEQGERFLQKVYTTAESQWCATLKKATEHFTAIWAAKEATLKALGVVSRRSSPWLQLEIRFAGSQASADIRGELLERMKGAQIKRIILATATSRHYATATAIALGER